jgi:hypothetical protein
MNVSKEAARLIVDLLTRAGGTGGAGNPLRATQRRGAPKGGHRGGEAQRAAERSELERYGARARGGGEPNPGAEAAAFRALELAFPALAAEIRAQAGEHGPAAWLALLLLDGLEGASAARVEQLEAQLARTRAEVRALRAAGAAAAPSLGRSRALELHPSAGASAVEAAGFEGRPLSAGLGGDGK